MKVSVVVTVLNEEASISKLIESLLYQTKKPDEIIIVDGGSTDKTIQLINQFKRADSPIKLIEKRGNRAIGRNAGINAAEGDIIAITDAGCIPQREWLAKLSKPFQDRTAQVVSGYYQPLVSNSFQEAVAPYFAVMPDQILPGKEFFPSSRSVAFRKTIWKKVGGYPEEFSDNEDFVFDHRLKKEGVNFFFVKNAVVLWSPPTNIVLASRQFFRFARGDAQTGIKRPKIRFIFARYFLGLLLLILGLYQLLSGGIISYIIWSIFKNRGYVRYPYWLWLPIIQITSDIAVMAGFLAGKVKRG